MNEMQIQRTIVQFIVFIFLLLCLFGFMILNFELKPETLSKTDSDFAVFNSALDLFKFDCGAFPTNDQGLTILRENTEIHEWNGPYMNEVINDPWGMPYQYIITKNGYEIRSAGADMKFGTSDDVTKVRDLK